MSASPAPGTASSSVQVASIAALEVSASSFISGTGMFVPPRVVTNHHFAEYLETNDEWIRERTGIVERRWAEPGVGVSELAEPAARDAISNAGLTIDDIDGIVFATVTPDYMFPSAACFLQARLGMKRGFAYDVNAVCTGFVYALATADSLIMNGLAKHILVIGGDVYSRIINPQDRRTCILFGDGAGAVVLSATQAKASATSASAKVKGSAATLRGIYGIELGADGTQTEILCVPQGSARVPTPESLVAGEHYLTMAGREVFKQAVRILSEVSENVCKKVGIDISDIDCVVSHQANKRILDTMAKQMGIPEHKVLCNVDRYGNTSAASIPIMLAEAVQKGTCKPGDLLLVSAFGGGVTWGAAVIRL